MLYYGFVFQTPSHPKDVINEANKSPYIIARGLTPKDIEKFYIAVGEHVVNVRTGIV